MRPIRKPYLLLLSLLFSAAALAADTAITVNGKAVAKPKVDAMVKNLARQNPQMSATDVDKAARIGPLTPLFGTQSRSQAGSGVS